MTLVLHLSADYPDEIQPIKTRAIAGLIDGTRGQLSHRVYSLNRTVTLAALTRPGTLKMVGDDGTVAICSYAAPPFGLFMIQAMNRVADAVAADLEQLGICPDVIHGHKLTFEGLAAQRLARLLNRPYILTLQGNTDQKLLRSRPDLHRAWRSCWLEAEHVFAFAPWIARHCSQILGSRVQGYEALPCLLASDHTLPPMPASPLIRTAFHLDGWRNKNIARLAQACAVLKREFPDLQLEIAGGGSQKAERAVDHQLAVAGISSFARRVGPLQPALIQAWMNQAAVFALASRRETFGMVFVEALLGGCPIVYPRGAAIDGYFDGQSFAVSADAGSVTSIAAALRAVLQDIAPRKAALAEWQASSNAAQFTTPQILSRYVAAIEQAAA